MIYMAQILTHCHDVPWQKRKAEAPSNDLHSIFKRQQEQENFKRLQQRMKEAEAQAIAARAEFEAATASHANNPSTVSNTLLLAPIMPVTQPTAPDAQPMVPADAEPVVLSDEEGNAMLKEWEDEIDAIHAYDDDVSFAMNKKIDKISNLLSHSGNAETPVEGTKANKPTGKANKENRLLKHEWQHGRPWLVYRDNKMYCTTCESAGKKNIFTAGCTQPKVYLIKKHEDLDDHKFASAAPRMADEFQVARMNAIKLEVRDNALLAFFFAGFFSLSHKTMSTIAYTLCMRFTG